MIIALSLLKEKVKTSLKLKDCQIFYVIKVFGIQTLVFINWVYLWVEHVYIFQVGTR